MKRAAGCRLRGLHIETLESRTTPTASIFHLSDLSPTDQGTEGLLIVGPEPGGKLGTNVFSGGDVNADGIDDYMIAAAAGYSDVDPGGDTIPGAVYVVFGRHGGFPDGVSLSDLDGTNGFKMVGSSGGDRAGNSLAMGDFNGDGIDDMVVGASLADPGGLSGAGITYVIFGKAGPFDAVINLSDLDGQNGFRVNGIDVGDVSGERTSAAGDFNGDGFDDLLIGAYRAGEGSAWTGSAVSVR